MSVKYRYSNIELLRIIATFLVLIVHADFFTLGEPSIAELQLSPLPSYTRYFIESLSIVCVNIFILISGWFGIHSSVKGLMKFIFQCSFFLIGIYIGCILLGFSKLSLKGIAGCLGLLKWNWFLKAYVGLYLLAPVLNSFLQTVSQKMVLTFLILFYIFQTIYGWSGAAIYFEQGYSTMSFIGLYILARYFNLYCNFNNIPSRFFFYLYLVSCCLNTALAIICNKWVPYNLDIYSYISPLVILSSISLFFTFVNMNIPCNKYINWISSSSFAMFLLHTNPGGGIQLFQKGVLSIYRSSSGIIFLLGTGLFLLIISIVAILLDQIRIALWNLLNSYMDKLGEKHTTLFRIWNYKSTI